MLYNRCLCFHFFIAMLGEGGDCDELQRPPLSLIEVVFVILDFSRWSPKLLPPFRYQHIDKKTGLVGSIFHSKGRKKLSRLLENMKPFVCTAPCRTELWIIWSGTCIHTITLGTINLPPARPLRATLIGASQWNISSVYLNISHFLQIPHTSALVRFTCFTIDRSLYVKHGLCKKIYTRLWKHGVFWPLVKSIVSTQIKQAINIHTMIFVIWK